MIIINLYDFYHVLFFVSEVNFVETLLKKLSYIWDYYKTIIIGLPLLFLFLFYVISTFSNQKEAPFSVYIINQDVSLDSCHLLEKDLARTLPSLMEDGNVLVDASLIINPQAPDADSQMTFTTAIAGHTIDIMISDESFVSFYAAKEALADLRTVLPKDLYEDLSPYILSFKNKEGDVIPYAIDVTANPFLAVLDTLNAPLLTIAKYSEHQNICEELLRIIFLQ